MVVFPSISKIICPPSSVSQDLFGLFFLITFVKKKKKEGKQPTQEYFLYFFMLVACKILIHMENMEKHSGNSKPISLQDWKIVNSYRNRTKALSFSLSLCLFGTPYTGNLLPFSEQCIINFDMIYDSLIVWVRITRRIWD